ncbi:unnamed protein product [Linum trigynum]|uniref:Uncharacterized protein n=1 Tax=Linum trigynum TaxID=586398 RepID=A0AAV2ERT6_9ROSI
MGLREATCGGLDDALKRRPPVAAAVKQFLLLTIGSMLVPKMSRLCDLDYVEYLQWPLGDIHFLMIHLLDFLNVRGFATKTIPACTYWFDPRVDKDWESGSSSSAPPTSYPQFYSTHLWEEIDLETLEDNELEALESLTKKVMDNWDSRRESVRRVIIKRQQENQ